MKVFQLYVLLFLVGCAPSQSQVITQDLTYNIARATVMITNLEGNSGGTGTIIDSQTDYSSILTNAHVCGVVKEGGFVHTNSSKYLVGKYIQSKVHDLCLIGVRDNLNIHTDLSTSSALEYSPATVSGHPHLMPTLITTGRFASKILIKIMTGVKPCTPEESLDVNTGLFCVLLGGLPVVKSYEATPVSALIQPGSSGSAVYNDKGQISAVIFAGSGDLGFGLAVPYEYVVNFLFIESKTLERQTPNNELKIGGASTSAKSLHLKLSEACTQATTDKQKEFCKIFLDAARNILLEN